MTKDGDKLVTELRLWVLYKAVENALIKKKLLEYHLKEGLR